MNNYPKAYLDYLIQFHGTRDFFECHEIMEEHWKKDGYKKHWLALIQLAVAIYHERQKNIKGSLRLYRKVLTHLRTDPSAISNLSIDVEALQNMIKMRIRNLLEEGPYEPINLPITDDSLIIRCKELCTDNYVSWCTIEDLDNESLIFRHKLRDRSDVIQERLASLKLKQTERKE
ncbi:DUF309 domain-containing protein [Evansella sp. AB-rgal1]|uniref:DUF309 domain-containing protein n=1 Tax=Evansella sp. AB-rgal1 TaxID=3242696 RepID=UPI00359CD9C8